MEELAIELAKVLNITVESAIDMMPIIRDQFVRFKVLNVLENMTWTSLIMFTILSFFLSVFKNEFLLEYPEYSVEEYDRQIRILRVIAIISLILTIAIIPIIKYVVATDYMILKEFL